MNRLSVGLVLALLTTSATYACSCANDPRPASVKISEAKHTGDAIFFGRVVDIKEADTLTVTLKVEEAWTAGISSYTTITTHLNGDSCGYPFSIDRNYLVIASKNEEGLSAYLCGLTEEGFPEDYKKALGPGYSPKNYAALWWEIGGTVWLATFVFLRIRNRRSQLR